MKKFIIALLVALVSCFALSADSEYYYGFILPCGESIVIASPYELSSDELEDMYNRLEKSRCGDTNSYESGLRTEP